MADDYELLTVGRFEEHEDRVHIFFAEYPGLGCPFLKENLMRRGIFSLEIGQNFLVKGNMSAGYSADETDIRRDIR